MFSSALILTIILFSIFNFVVTPKKYNNYVEVYAEEYNLDRALVYAVIKVESDFNKKALSSAGAMGLMQLIPSTASWIAGELGENFEKDNLYDPETNIKYGCFYLNYLFGKFNDISAVVCAYNAGETIVKNWLNESGKIEESKITYSETKKYYKKVLGYYNTYQNNEIYQ